MNNQGLVMTHTDLLTPNWSTRLLLKRKYTSTRDNERSPAIIDGHKMFFFRNKKTITTRAATGITQKILKAKSPIINKEI